MKVRIIIFLLVIILVKVILLHMLNNSKAIISKRHGNWIADKNTDNIDQLQ